VPEIKICQESATARIYRVFLKKKACGEWRLSLEAVTANITAIYDGLLCGNPRALYGRNSFGIARAISPLTVASARL